MAQNPNYRWQRALPEYSSASSTSYRAYPVDSHGRNVQSAHRGSREPLSAMNLMQLSVPLQLAPDPIP